MFETNPTKYDGQWKTMENSDFVVFRFVSVEQNWIVDFARKSNMAPGTRATVKDTQQNLNTIFILMYLRSDSLIHHHKPINDPTAGVQAFLTDYT
jgi:hypothetical protein